MHLKEQGLNSENFVGINLEKKIGLIGGTSYTGENKKLAFTLYNYWMPLEKKLSLHCGASVNKSGESILFLGLSGTGKTSLITHFLLSPRFENFKIAVTGCTNKAVGVLESSFFKMNQNNKEEDKVVPLDDEKAIEFWKKRDKDLEEYMKQAQELWNDSCTTPRKNNE